MTVENAPFGSFLSIHEEKAEGLSVASASISFAAVAMLRTQSLFENGCEPTVPVYLSGGVREEWAQVPGMGFMLTPNMGNELPHGSIWAADTGCYSEDGARKFDLDRYLGWLEKRPRETCLLATAPDKVGYAAVTLALSAPVLPHIRRLGYPASLVAQDGLEHLTVPWEDFDVLFIGGTTAWKLGPHAQALMLEAAQRGVPTHVGRVNSLKRLRYASRFGVRSVDGTYLTRGPDVNFPKMVGWFTRLMLEA